MEKITLSTGKEITMRTLKVRDMRAVSGITDDSEREFTIISNLTGLTTEELDDLEWSDYVKLQHALAKMGN